MRILHISDLHLKAQSGISDNRILARLYGFLKANAADKKFDCIVITGDLRNVYNGASIDEAFLIVENIVKSTNVAEKSSIHIVPGNHDLKRGTEDKDTIGKIRKNYNYDSGTFSDIKTEMPLMHARFDDFYWPFCEKFYGSSNPWKKGDVNPHRIYVREKNAFIYLNSCLTCIENNADGNLIIGLEYLKELCDLAEDAINIFILSHHPIQNLAAREESGLQEVVEIYPQKKFYWLCGDAHNNRTKSKDYIHLLQVGSLMGASSTIPDFAIYDIDGDKMELERRVFRFLPHLNSSSPVKGGWKRVYIDRKVPSLHASEI